MVATLRWPLRLCLTDSRHLIQDEGVLTGVVGAMAGFAELLLHCRLRVIVQR